MRLPKERSQESKRSIFESVRGVRDAERGFNVLDLSFIPVAAGGSSHQRLPGIQ